MAPGATEDGHIVAKRYFNPRRNRFNFRPPEIKGFVLVCLLVVVMTRQRVEALTAELGLFLQQYGGVFAVLIILIAAGLLYMGIQKKRNRRLEEETRFAPCAWWISTAYIRLDLRSM